jgi:hypothetical protein
MLAQATQVLNGGHLSAILTSPLVRQPKRPTGLRRPASVGFLARLESHTMSGMSKAKSPDDKCAECGHPRRVHHEYSTPHCIPDARPGQPAEACGCLEFSE